MNDEIQNQIIHLGEEIKRLEQMQRDFGSAIKKIQGHSHSGHDFPQVSGRDILGFRVNTVDTASVKPTFGVSEGVIVIQKDASDTYLWANTGGAWRGVQLTST